jgi:hypothetical protein
VAGGAAKKLEEFASTAPRPLNTEGIDVYHHVISYQVVGPESYPKFLILSAGLLRQGTPEIFCRPARHPSWVFVA